MNAKKLQLEVMRAVLRSSSLEHDDAYQVLRRIFPAILFEVQKQEEKKKNDESKTNRRRSP